MMNDHEGEYLTEERKRQLNEVESNYWKFAGEGSRSGKARGVARALFGIGFAAVILFTIFVLVR